MNETPTVMSIQDRSAKLTPIQLAEAIYEGTQHLSNLAEKLARHHGKAGALCFFGMMGEDVQNFYLGIAQQLIDHAKMWKENEGSACVLDESEEKRLAELPRHPDLATHRKLIEDRFNEKNGLR